MNLYPTSSSWIDYLSILLQYFCFHSPCSWKIEHWMKASTAKQVWTEVYRCAYSHCQRHGTSHMQHFVKVFTIISLSRMFTYLVGVHVSVCGCFVLRWYYYRAFPPLYARLWHIDPWRIVWIETKTNKVLSFSVCIVYNFLNGFCSFFVFFSFTFPHFIFCMFGFDVCAISYYVRISYAYSLCASWTFHDEIDPVDPTSSQLT